MKEDPIKQLQDWWDRALDKSPLNQKHAACLSTIRQDGYPSGRFVGVKEIYEGCPVFCTSLESNKAREITANPCVALTIWWDHIGYQIRITGTAVSVSEEQAIRYWISRSLEAQITSTCSRQSQTIDNLQNLSEQIESHKRTMGSDRLPKPDSWGCYKILPHQIEFLTFDNNRIHLRELYEKTDCKWNKKVLQP
jgi:pyridoxamine 5'-phosphate oxidase